MRKAQQTVRLRVRRFFFLACFIFPWTALFPQAGDTGQEDPEHTSDSEPRLSMAVAAVTAPARPVVRGTLTVTILADHPVTSEVTVRPPRFPPALILERVRTEARYIRQPGRLDEAGPLPDPTRWTAVEFLFTPLVSGEITLDPFEVTAAGKKAATEIISVRVYEESRSARRNIPAFRWEAPPSSLTIGESREIILALANWDSEMSPPRSFFRGRVPPNTVMEELSPAGAGEDGTIRYRFRIIPLEGSVLILESFSFQAGGLDLEVPRLSLTLVPAQKAVSREEAAAVPPDGSSSTPAQEELPVDDGRALPFPETGGEVFPLFRGEYERITGEARALWEEGHYAQALALMRGNERDGFPGPAFAPLRRAMEHSLGLSLTGDEQWRPWKSPVFSVAAVLFLLCAAAAAWKIHVTSARFKGYKNVVIVVVTGSLVILLFLGGLGDRLRKPGDRGDTAVLEKTAAYRVPDTEGAVNALFGEGQPVIIRSGRRLWIYAESIDGRAGWVPAEAVIPY
jgi:hypothetical protein